MTTTPTRRDLTALEARQMARDLERASETMRESHPSASRTLRAHVRRLQAAALPAKGEPLTCTDAIVRAVQANGSHFFDADTMRQFGSRLAPDCLPLPDGSALFITSEADRYGTVHAHGGARKYTVRLCFYDPQHGATIIEPTAPHRDSTKALEGGFCAFESLRAARSFMESLRGKTARELAPAIHFQGWD